AAVALEDASARGDDVDTCQLRHLLVEVERLLDEQRYAALEVDQHGPVRTPRESEVHEASLPRCAGRELPRLLLVVGKLRRLFDRQWLLHAGFTTFGLRSSSKSRSRRMRAVSSRMPVPFLQFVKMNGFLPRMAWASCRITSRLAPTYGARSVLLMTRMS